MRGLFSQGVMPNDTCSKTRPSFSHRVRQFCFRFKDDAISNIFVSSGCGLRAKKGQPRGVPQRDTIIGGT